MKITILGDPDLCRQAWEKVWPSKGLFDLWQGKTWIEQNRIVAVSVDVLKDLLDAVPGGVQVRYLVPGFPELDGSRISLDEVGYLFYPGIAKMINFHHLARACEKRFDSVDFLCGDFNWKERFHLSPRPLYKFVCTGGIPIYEEHFHDRAVA